MDTPEAQEPPLDILLAFTTVFSRRLTRPPLARQLPSAIGPRPQPQPQPRDPPLVRTPASNAPTTTFRPKQQQRIPEPPAPQRRIHIHRPNPEKDEDKNYTLDTAVMFPAGAGHQLDLNHLWQQVQELSAVLAANRESTVGLVKKADEIRVRLFPLPLQETWRES